MAEASFSPTNPVEIIESGMEKYPIVRDSLEEENWVISVIIWLDKIYYTLESEMDTGPILSFDFEEEELISIGKQSFFKTHLNVNVGDKLLVKEFNYSNNTADWVPPNSLLYNLNFNHKEINLGDVGTIERIIATEFATIYYMKFSDNENIFTFLEEQLGKN